MASRRPGSRTESIRWNVLMDSCHIQEEDEDHSQSQGKQRSKKKDKLKKGKKSTIVDLRAAPDENSGPDASGSASLHAVESLSQGLSPAQQSYGEVQLAVPNGGVWREVSCDRSLGRKSTVREVWGAKEAHGLASLTEMFEGVLDPEIVCSVYRDADYSVESAAEMLLAISINAHNSSSLLIGHTPPDLSAGKQPKGDGQSGKASASGMTLEDGKRTSRSCAAERTPSTERPNSGATLANWSAGTSWPANEEPVHPWETVPLECQLIIFELLTMRERARIAPVCKSFATLVKTMRETLRSLHLPSKASGAHLPAMVAAHPNLKSLSFRRCGGQVRNFVSIFASASGLPELIEPATVPDSWEIDDSFYTHPKICDRASPAGSRWQPQALSVEARNFTSSRLVPLDSKDGRWITPWLESDGAGGCYLRSGASPERSLRAVDLHRCVHLEDGDVAALCVLHGQLEEVDLSYCNNISDRALQTLASYRHFPLALPQLAQAEPSSAEKAFVKGEAATWPGSVQEEIPPELLRTMGELGLGLDSSNEISEEVGMTSGPDDWPELRGSAVSARASIQTNTIASSSVLSGLGSNGKISTAALEEDTRPRLSGPSKSWSDLVAGAESTEGQSEPEADSATYQSSLNSSLDRVDGGVRRQLEPLEGRTSPSGPLPAGHSSLAECPSELESSRFGSARGFGVETTQEADLDEGSGLPHTGSSEEVPPGMAQGPEGDMEVLEDGLESFTFSQRQAGGREGSEPAVPQGSGLTGSPEQGGTCAGPAEPGLSLQDKDTAEAATERTEGSGLLIAQEPGIQGGLGESRPNFEPTRAAPHSSLDPSSVQSGLSPEAPPEAEASASSSSQSVISVSRNGNKPTSSTSASKQKARSPLLFDWLQDRGVGGATWHQIIGGAETHSQAEDPAEIPRSSPGGIKAVHLAGCEKISDSGVQTVLGGTVEVLDVARCPGLANSWLRLPVHSRLRQLSAAGLEGLTTVTLLLPAGGPLEEASFSQCPKLSCVTLHSRSLRTLSLGGCPALSSLTLLCPRLSTLTLSHCSTLPTLGRLRTPSLRSLNLFLCTSLGGGSFSALESLALLEELDCSGCRGLAEGDLRAPGLRRLTVAGATQLARLVVRSPLLEQLDCSGCEALGELRLHSPHLRRLLLPNCPRLRILALPIRAICEAAERAKWEAEAAGKKPKRWFDLQTNGTLPPDLERYLLNLQV